MGDDCLGRTLDWLYVLDPTTLFAAIAPLARHAFGISARQVHVDTTLFSASGAYTAPEEAAARAVGSELAAGSDLDTRAVAITYGYSRDQRADLKQWMLALATTREGEVPLFLLRPLDGNSGDQISLVDAQVRSPSPNTSLRRSCSKGRRSSWWRPVAPR